MIVACCKYCSGAIEAKRKGPSNAMRQPLLMLTSTLLLLQCVDGKSDLPFPWLTVTHSTHVLRLVCTAPAESSDWKGVYGLRLSALLTHYSVSHNTSLANITSDKNELKVNSIFPVSRPTFTGSWESKTATLTMIMPITHNELGHYFCSGDYQSTEGYYYIFSNRMTVDKEFVGRHRHWKDGEKSGKFEVGVEDASKLDITWHRPDALDFEEARVTRTITDPEGNRISPPLTLLTRVGARDFELRSSVLLSRSFANNGQNYSMAVYVASEACYLYCRYDCSVSYKSCIRSRADSCVCRQAGDRRESMTSTSGPLTDSTVVIVTSGHMENSTVAISSSGSMTGYIVAVSILSCLFGVVVAIAIYMGLRYRRKVLSLKERQGRNPEEPSAKEIKDSKKEDHTEKKPLLNGGDVDISLDEAGRSTHSNNIEEEMARDLNTNIPDRKTSEDNRDEDDVTNNESLPSTQTVTPQVDSADNEISPSPQRDLFVEQKLGNTGPKAGVAGNEIPVADSGSGVPPSNNKDTGIPAGAGSAASASSRHLDPDDKANNGNSHAVQVHEQSKGKNFGHTDTKSSFKTPQPTEDARESGNLRENPTSMQPSQHVPRHRSDGDNSSYDNARVRHGSSCQLEHNPQLKLRTKRPANEKGQCISP